MIVALPGLFSYFCLFFSFKGNGYALIRDHSQNGFASLLKWAYSGESKFFPLGVDAVKQIVFFKSRLLSRWRLAYRKANRKSQKLFLVVEMRSRSTMCILKM